MVMLPKEEEEKEGNYKNESNYLDWNNSMATLNKAYEAGLFVLVIGPKGTGKTTLVRDFVKSKSAKLESINFSLRTRESHLVGTKTLQDGSVGFDEGILVKSMREASVLYLDEINAAEADVLLRLDEALDDRRQIVLKESAGQTVKASQGWFVVATINPLTHVGTKELPPQILSRFPVRIKLEYPPENIEFDIVKKHNNVSKQSGGDYRSFDDKVIQGIKLANTLRQAAAVEELYYSPSLRETISYAKLLGLDVPAKKAAELVFGNVYAQWGDVEHQKVSDIITSMFESS